jgi:hypothetical protein
VLCWSRTAGATNPERIAINREPLPTRADRLSARPDPIAVKPEPLSTNLFLYNLFYATPKRLLVESWKQAEDREIHHAKEIESAERSLKTLRLKLQKESDARIARMAETAIGHLRNGENTPLRALQKAMAATLSSEEEIVAVCELMGADHPFLMRDNSHPDCGSLMFVGHWLTLMQQAAERKVELTNQFVAAQFLLNVLGKP